MHISQSSPLKAGFCLQRSWRTYRALHVRLSSFLQKFILFIFKNFQCLLLRNRPELKELKKSTKLKKNHTVAGTAVKLVWGTLSKKIKQKINNRKAKKLRKKKNGKKKNEKTVEESFLEDDGFDFNENAVSGVISESDSSTNDNNNNKDKQKDGEFDEVVKNEQENDEDEDEDEDEEEEEDDEDTESSNSSKSNVPSVSTASNEEKKDGIVVHESQKRKFQLRNELLDSIMYGLGTFYYIMSLLPSNIVGLLAVVGFGSGNKVLGLRYLHGVVKGKGLRMGNPFFFHFSFKKINN